MRIAKIIIKDELIKSFEHCKQFEHCKITAKKKIE